MKSLYERIGGTVIVEAIVDEFYDKVLSDDRLSHFFENTNMDHLRSHQKLFIMYIFGGADSYIGKNLHEAHKHLVDNMGLSDDHFDVMLENLRSTLAEFKIDDNLIEEALEITKSLRTSVLNRKSI